MKLFKKKIEEPPKPVEKKSHLEKARENIHYAEHSAITTHATVYYLAANAHLMMHFAEKEENASRHS